MREKLENSKQKLSAISANHSKKTDRLEQKIRELNGLLSKKEESYTALKSLSEKQSTTMKASVSKQVGEMFKCTCGSFCIEFAADTNKQQTKYIYIYIYIYIYKGLEADGNAGMVLRTKPATD